MTRTRTVFVSSVFPAAANQVWDRLTRVETLQYIAAPYATFVPLDRGKELIWKEGETTRFRLYLFGLMPLGVHTIHMRRFDRETYSVYTEENSRALPVWNHSISIVPLGEESACYTDEVTIGAGFMTGIVSLWSRLFFRHRQRKWKRLLSGK